jgi:hypothetical protein
MSHFVSSENIKRFWMFDSDTMIVRSLEEYEEKLLMFDNTEQCNGICMNGFIGNSDTLKNYVDDMNRMFQDEDMMEQQRLSLKNAPSNWAFTEMRAYEIFRNRNSPKSVRLKDAIEGVTFDEALCYEHDMEMQTSGGIQHKKIGVDGSGLMYFKQKKTAEWLPVVTLNLSWLPLYFFRTIDRIMTDYRSSGELAEIVFEEGKLDKVFNKCKFILSKILR